MAREGWVDDLAKTGMRAVLCPMMRQGVWFTKNGHTVDYAWTRKRARRPSRLDEDHRRCAETSQRTIGRHGRAGADRHLPRRLLQGSAPGSQEARPADADPCCQAVVEFHEMVRRHGKTPIEWLDSIGVLGPDLVSATASS